MSFTKIAALLAVAAASTQLVSAEVGQYEIVEFDAILADVKANLEQYMSFEFFCYSMQVLFTNPFTN